MYILPECWNTYQIVFYFPKESVKVGSSSLRKKFNHKLARMREAGLMQKWLNAEMELAGKRSRQRAASKTTIEPLSLAHTGPVFMGCGILALCCLIVLFVEVTWRRNGRNWLSTKLESQRAFHRVRNPSLAP